MTKLTTCNDVKLPPLVALQVVITTTCSATSDDKVIMMPTLSSLVALQVVITTTCIAASDDKVQYIYIKQLSPSPLCIPASRCLHHKATLQWHWAPCLQDSQSCIASDPHSITWDKAEGELFTLLHIITHSVWQEWEAGARATQHFQHNEAKINCILQTAFQMSFFFKDNWVNVKFRGLELLKKIELFQEKLFLNKNWVKVHLRGLELFEEI